MSVNYSKEFIEDCISKYYQQEVRKIQQESNYKLVFTDYKVYDLDKIILMRRRDVGNTPSAIHVIDKDEDNYADIMLVFLVIEHMLFNEDENAMYKVSYDYEQEPRFRESRLREGSAGSLIYEYYNDIREVPNYIAKIQAVLDPSINSDVLDYLYTNYLDEKINNRDGWIQIKDSGEKNFFDITDIYDPDDVL